MKRQRSLLFTSFELFRSWYTRMKTRFESLALALLRHFRSSKEVRVVITY